MPRGETHPRGMRRHVALSALALTVSLLATLLPLVRVVAPGGWLIGAVALVVALVAFAAIARAWHAPAWAVSLGAAMLWALAIMLAFFSATAIAGVIPTTTTIQTARVFVEQASQQIVEGYAPLTAGTPLAFVLVAAFGLLAIAMDHVVLTARMPLLASIGLVAVFLVPQLAVPGDFDGWAFAVLATGLVVMLRADARWREHDAARADTASRPSSARSARSVPGTAIAIGAVAVIVAVSLAPALPTPVASGSGGGVSAVSITADLDLGDDLRQPREVEVMTVNTTASSAPYLRVATISDLGAQSWQSDEPDRQALTAGFGSLPLGSQIARADVETTIDVGPLSTRLLPVPFAAVNVTGLSGEWQAAAANRTVASSDSSTRGQEYVVDSVTVEPTLAQVSGTFAGGEAADASLTALPSDMPAVISATALEVVDGATNDYEAAADLQSWLRGSDFTYSLSAPVSDDVGEDPAAIVAEFLDVREGYCVHFASAFTLMARTLGMPSRIVVGYLPGTSTGESIDDQPIYSVLSSQLHAWSEIHFDGIGWVRFDPTKSLGEPTAITDTDGSTPADQADTDTPDQQGATDGPSASTDPTDAGAIDPDVGDAAAPGRVTTQSLWTTAGVFAGLLLIAAAPGVAAASRRAGLRRAARRGDARAAWRFVQDAAIDLGIPVDPTLSPRAFARMLVAERGADEEAMATLTRAIEAAAFAPPPRPDHSSPGLDLAADEVRTRMRAAASPAARFGALVLPRSLAPRTASHATT